MSLLKLTDFLSLIVLSEIAFSQAPYDECDYGNWDTVNSECTYECKMYNSAASSNIDIAELTFENIVDECVGVRLAIQEYGSQSCSSLDDLVWKENSCRCPYCKCTSPLTTAFFTSNTYFRKTCNECQCTYTNTAQTEFGWECTQKYSVDTVAQWNQYTCSNNLVTCQDASGFTQYPGDGWFVSYAWVTGPWCETYCYCNFDGTIDCEETYADILNSANTALTNAFKDECDWKAAGCFNEPSLMFNTSRYCQCPRCHCPSGSTNEGDTFHTEFTMVDMSFDSTGPNDDTTCMPCTCTDRGYGLQQDCDRYAGNGDSSYAQGEETCPQPIRGTCLTGSASSSSRSAANNGGGLMQTDCYGEENQNCGVTYAPEEGYMWQCQNSLFCQAFTTGNLDCVHLNVNLNMNIDCANDPDGGGVSINSIEQYTTCCAGNNCNDFDIDIAQCEENPEVNQWYSDFLECKYGALYQDFFCSPVTTYSCADIQRLGTWYFGCDCSAYSDIYIKTTPQWKNWLARDLQSSISQLDGWSTYFGCDLSFTCNLDDGVMSVNDQPQAEVTAKPTERPTTAQPSTSSPTQQTISPTTASPTDNTAPPTTSRPTPVTTNPSAAPTSNGDQCLLIKFFRPFVQEIEEAFCDYCYEDKSQQQVCARMVDIITGISEWPESIVDIPACFLEYCEELECTFDKVGIKSGAEPKQDCSCNIFDCNGGAKPSSDAYQLGVFVVIGIGFLTLMHV